MRKNTSSPYLIKMKFGRDQEPTPLHPCTKFQINRIIRMPVADRQNHRAGVRGKRRVMARSSARDRGDLPRQERKGSSEPDKDR